MAGAIRSTHESHEMLVNGLELNVLIEGEGEPVLLLHGFPDSHALWRDVVPRLTAEGYRVIAPDQRGFGRSDAPNDVDSYTVELVAKDALAILDELAVDKARLVGHDWGAVIGWLLASTHPERFESLVAISVGHPRAYAAAGWEQKKKGWYILFFQLRGVAEWVVSAHDWSLFRKAVKEHPETDRWIQDLSRPGRLTAAMNWYRANLYELWKASVPPVKIPVLGIWSTGDAALTEEQMAGSVDFVEASWSYERLEDIGHWIPLEAPDWLSRKLLEFYR